MDGVFQHGASVPPSVSTQLWTLAYFRRSEVKIWNTEFHCEVVCVVAFHYALSSMGILLKKNYF